MTSYLSHAVLISGLTIVQRAMGLLTTVVLSRILGPSGFGMYSIVINTATSLYSILRMGVDSSIVSIASNQQDERIRGELLGAALVILTLVGCSGGLICVVGAEFMANELFNNPDLKSWLKWSGALVILQCLSQFFYCLLVGFHRFKSYANSMAYGTVLGACAIFIGVYAFNLTGAILGYVSSQCISFIFLIVATKKVAQEESLGLNLKNLYTNIKQVLQRGSSLYFSGLISVPVIYYVQTLLVKSGGLEAMGGSRVIASITMMILILPSSISSVIIAHFVKKSTSDYSNFVNFFVFNMKLIWVFLVMSCTLILPILPFIMKYIFGENYTQYTSAACYAIVGCIFSVLVTMVNNVSFARSKTKLVLQYVSIQAFILIVSSYFLVPILLLDGFYISEIISNIVALIFIWFSTLQWRKKNLISPHWAYHLATLSSFLIFIAIINVFIKEYYLVTFICYLFLFLTGYISYKFILTSVEKILLLNSLKNLKIKLYK